MFLDKIRREIRFRRLQTAHRRTGRMFVTDVLKTADAATVSKGSVEALAHAISRGMKIWPGTDLSLEEQVYERQKPLHYIKLQLQLLRHISGKIIVEIGSSRSPMRHGIDEFDPSCCNDGHSTYHWASPGKFEVHTVDICPDSKALLDKAALPNLTAHTCDGIAFLEDWKGGSIDFLFLDAWDVGVPDYAEKHLEAFHAVKGKLAARHIIGIDDTDFLGEGKGKLLVPVLRSLGYRQVVEGRQTVFINFDIP